MLAIWAIASTVTQIRRAAAQRLRRFDSLGLLPAWNFFAPRPLTCDFLVRYRAWSAHEGYGPWSALDLPRPRSLTDAVFNPTRREKKTLFEACARVVAGYRRHPDADTAMIGMSYLLILGHVSAHVSRDADGVQFAIWLLPAGARGLEDGRRVFRSAVHTVDRLPEAHGAGTEGRASIAARPHAFA